MTIYKDTHFLLTLYKKRELYAFLEGMRKLYSNRYRTHKKSRGLNDCVFKKCIAEKGKF